MLNTFKQAIEKFDKIKPLSIRLYVVMEELHRKFFNTDIKLKSIKGILYVFAETQKEFAEAERVIDETNNRGVPIILAEVEDG